MRWNCWCLAALLIAGCRNVQSADRPAAAACGWGARDSIRLDDGLVYVEPLTSAAVGGDLVVIGHQAVKRSLGGKAQPRSSETFWLAGIRMDDSARARAIDLPPGVTAFNRVRVAQLPGGKIAVVWQGGTDLRDTVVSRLWTSTLDGAQWSRPRQLGDWRARDIGLYYASALTARGDDLALVVPGFHDTTAVYVRVSGAWHRRTLVRPTPLYAALLATRDGYLLALVDSRGLSASKLTVDGASTPFVSIAPANGSDFHQPILLTSTPSETIVAWVEGMWVGRSIVHVARSSDLGTTWKEAEPLAVEGGIQGFDAIVRGGAVYVTGRQSTEDGPWPFVAALHGPRWRVLPVHRGANEIDIVPPRFSRRGTEPELLWGVLEASRAGSEPPVSVRSRLRGDCRP